MVLRKFHISKEFLELEYVQNNKTSQQIAEEIGFSKDVVIRRIKEFKIPINKKQRNTKIDQILFGFENNKLKLKEFLEKSHLKEKKTYEEMSKELNCCVTTIHRFMKEFGIKPIKRPGNRRKILPEKEMINHYVNENYSINKLAREFGVSGTTIKTRLVENNIKLKTQEEVNLLKFVPKTESGMKSFKEKMSLYRNKKWNGRTLLKQRIRDCFNYREWRSNIFKRDNYTCVECFKRGGKLNADHIKPFAVILNENKIETFEKALFCKDLWDLKNGRTLCLCCHKETDTWGRNVVKNYKGDIL